MAKIIKVGSQNPTFTSSKTKKSNPIQTHRNSNEATNPFKFTNFEGKTLPFEYADVFAGSLPKSANKLRLIATSVTGSMSKYKSRFTESIANFANRIRTHISTVKDVLNTPIHIAAIDNLSEYVSNRLSGHIASLKEGWALSKELLNRDIVDIGKEISEKCANKLPSMVPVIMPSISFRGRQKYSNMTVAELESHLAAALAEGGSNE